MQFRNLFNDFLVISSTRIEDLKQYDSLTTQYQYLILYQELVLITIKNEYLTMITQHNLAGETSSVCTTYLNPSIKLHTSINLSSKINLHYLR